MKIFILILCFAYSIQAEGNFEVECNTPLHLIRDVETAKLYIQENGTTDLHVKNCDDRNPLEALLLYNTNIDMELVDLFIEMVQKFTQA